MKHQISRAKLDIYDRYPTMKPYVGRHFHAPGKPSILLVGESHYLPHGSSQHATPKRWYSGSSATLSEEEILWISTKRIITESREDGFRNKAHSIYRKAFTVINACGPAYSDYARVADDVAFYNFFLRPGQTGDSVAPTDEDCQVAFEAFVSHYKRLKPSAVVFLSSLAFNCFDGSPASSCVTVDMIRTPHPCCRWWNRPAKSYDNRSGQQVLGDFVKSLKWKKRR